MNKANTAPFCTDRRRGLRKVISNAPIYGSTANLPPKHFDIFLACLRRFVPVVCSGDPKNRYLFSVAKVPFLDYNSYDFALIVGPLFSSVNSVAGVLLSLVGDARPVRVSLLRSFAVFRFFLVEFSVHNTNAKKK